MKKLENIRYEEMMGLVESLVLTQLHSNLKDLPREEQRKALHNICSTHDEVRIVDSIIDGR